VRGDRQARASADRKASGESIWTVVVELVVVVVELSERVCGVENV